MVPRGGVGHQRGGAGGPRPRSRSVRSLNEQMFERAQQSNAQLSRSPAAEALMTTANARVWQRSPVQPIGIAGKTRIATCLSTPPARAGRLTRPSRAQSPGPGDTISTYPVIGCTKRQRQLPAKCRSGEDWRGAASSNRSDIVQGRVWRLQVGSAEPCPPHVRVVSKVVVSSAVELPPTQMSKVELSRTQFRAVVLQ